MADWGSPRCPRAGRVEPASGDRHFWGFQVESPRRTLEYLEVHSRLLRRNSPPPPPGAKAKGPLPCPAPGQPFHQEEGRRRRGRRENSALWKSSPPPTAGPSATPPPGRREEEAPRRAGTEAAPARRPGRGLLGAAYRAGPGRGCSGRCRSPAPPSCAAAGPPVGSAWRGSPPGAAGRAACLREGETEREPSEPRRPLHAPRGTLKAPPPPLPSPRPPRRPTLPPDGHGERRSGLPPSLPPSSATLLAPSGRTGGAGSPKVFRQDGGTGGRLATPPGRPPIRVRRPAPYLPGGADQVSARPRPRPESFG